MRPPKFLIPIIVLLGVVLFQAAFIVQEINQAIVLQFGNPKRIITDKNAKTLNAIINPPKIFPAFI